MRYNIVEVRWVDTTRSASEWSDASEIAKIAYADPKKDSLIHSVGVLVCKTNQCLTLAAHADGEYLLHVLIIPRVAVVSTKVIGSVKDWPKLPKP